MLKSECLLRGSVALLVLLTFALPSRPAMGKSTKDPIHSANFGIGFQNRCQELGIDCEIMYPDAPDAAHKTTTDYLVAKLKADKTH